MKNEIPFIKLFNSPYGFYFFDVNTNKIYRIDKDIWNALEKICSGEEYKLSDSQLIKIQKMRNAGLLKSNRPKIIRHQLSDSIDYYLNNKIEGITLQITQNCNFLCDYCPYSQGKESLGRKHTDKSMSFETAKKGIEFLLERSRDSGSIHVSFYGGEPLLEFDMIKEIVPYAKQKFIGKHLRLNMTTNASLLTASILNYLVENEINIMISLDGPKEIHDKNRKFAINGHGTFDIIMERLNLIKEMHPQYLR